MAIDPISSGAIFSILRNIQIQSAQIAQSTQRLSSGFRVNSAADDPAGIVRVQRFLSRIRSFDAAVVNIQTSTSMVQSAEGGLTSIQDILDEIEDLAVSAQTSTNVDDATERANIAAQLNTLNDEITDLIASTKFNKQELLQGGTAKVFQTGPDAGQSFSWTPPTVDTAGSSSRSAADGTTILTTPKTVPNSVGGDTTRSFNQAFSDLTSALTTFVSTTDVAEKGANLVRLVSGTASQSGVSDDTGGQISNIGAVESRLTAALNNVKSMRDASKTALSAIRDTDIAAETVALSRAQLLQQSGIAILGLFSIQAQQVLKLLSPT